MQWFRVDLKTFLGLDMPNQCCHAVKMLIFGGFLGRIFLTRTPNLNDVLPYYMIKKNKSTPRWGIEPQSPV